MLRLKIVFFCHSLLAAVCNDVAAVGSTVLTHLSFDHSPDASLI